MHSSCHLDHSHSPTKREWLSCVAVTFATIGTFMGVVMLVIAASDIFVGGTASIGIAGVLTTSILAIHAATDTEDVSALLGDVGERRYFCV